MMVMMIARGAQIELSSIHQHIPLGFQRGCTDLPIPLDICLDGVGGNAHFPLGFCELIGWFLVFVFWMFLVIRLIGKYVRFLLTQFGAEFLANFGHPLKNKEK